MHMLRETLFKFNCLFYKSVDKLKDVLISRIRKSTTFAVSTCQLGNILAYISPAISLALILIHIHIP